MNSKVTIGQIADALRKNLPNPQRRDVCRDWLWLVGELAYDLSQVAAFDRDAFLKRSGYAEVFGWAYPEVMPTQPQEAVP